MGPDDVRYRLHDGDPYIPRLNERKYLNRIPPVLLEELFENLSLTVEPFASCRVAKGWRLQPPLRDWVTEQFGTSPVKYRAETN